METAILFAMVLGFLFVGVPVGLSLGLSSILYVALFTTESLSSVAISLFGVGTHYTLLWRSTASRNLAATDNVRFLSQK